MDAHGIITGLRFLKVCFEPPMSSHSSALLFLLLHLLGPGEEAVSMDRGKRPASKRHHLSINSNGCRIPSGIRRGISLSKTKQPYRRRLGELK